MSKSYNLNDTIIYLKVENAYAVWFKATCKFLMIEEPAFYILKLLLKNIPIDQLANMFSHQYKIPLDETKKFILELNINFQQYLNPPRKEKTNAKPITLRQFQGDKYFSKKTYSVDNLILKIDFGEKELEDVIHPLFAHHQIDKNTKSNYYFEIFRQSEKLFFKVNNIIVEEFNQKETGYLKAAVLLKLLGILNGVKHENWMMTVHAAAVTNGSSALVFPALAGSGKSTLATFLHAHGFSMLSDDFLAMDVINKRVYNLPVASTIKDGSVKVLSPFFPELKEIAAERAYTGKQVRYLPIQNSLKANGGFPTKKFVFITYSESKPLTFERVDKKTALQALLEETWVNPVPSVVSEFFNWFDKTQFYKLQYSNTSDALKVVNRLFK
jgi:hypothetical protein